MEDLIRHAFMHVDIVGAEVEEGHYDLIGPTGEIILPQDWETVLEPGWTITMRMWPKSHGPAPVATDSPTSKSSYFPTPVLTA